MKKTGDAKLRLALAGDRLFEAALVIAQTANPALDICPYLDTLNAWGKQLNERAPVADDVGGTLGLLNAFMFKELEFKGNRDDYYDPRNSYVNEVLNRRTGIPISIAIVYMELGRRLGLKLEGISFPGHFLVALNTGEDRMIIDPFNHGQVLGAPVLRRRISELFSTEFEELEPFLKIASTREILVRMLSNLKTVYRHRNELENALRCTSQIIDIAPRRYEEYRDRGLLLDELQCPHSALADLNEYLKRKPNAQDAGPLREKIFDLQTQYGRLN